MRHIAECPECGGVVAGTEETPPMSWWVLVSREHDPDERRRLVGLALRAEGWEP